MPTRRLVALVAAVMIALAVGVSPGDPPAAQTKWLLSYDQALVTAKKTRKTILAYFSGSDWDPWTQKLEQDVLETETFRHWAAENVILLRVDFPREKKLNGFLTAQNNKLRVQYNISKVPSFSFLDPSGLPYARAGYDDLRLRDDERTGEPIAAIKFLDHIITLRPKDELIVEQKTLADGIAYARKHFISLLILVSQGNAPGPVKTKADLLDSQPFVRFVNRTMAFVNLTWPEDSDTSPSASEFRALLAKNKVTPEPLQLLVWDMQTGKIKGRMTAIFPDHVEPLLAQIENQLPRLDLPDGWIEDMRLAQAVASQQDRYIFIDFTSLDSSDWCQKLQSEILDTDDFMSLAKKRLVLLRIDFPKTTTQPEALRAQNQTLAEMYDVRGFPTIIVLNPLGQKVSDAKYMKGGPGPLIAQLSDVMKKDTERRAMLNNTDSREKWGGGAGSGVMREDSAGNLHFLTPEPSRPPNSPQQFRQPDVRIS
jgi:protein disulfide-isomerase